MAAPFPTLLALDFDGVICDGLIEYFQVSWRAYCQIWSPVDATPPTGLAEQFYRTRPVVETGWEMPVLVRSLLLGTPEPEILEHWPAIVQSLIQAEQLTPAALSHQVDTLRDQWIGTDLAGWLELHQFYPGVVERLQQILAGSTRLVIVTTKEGRFVHQLLRRQGIELADDQVFGKEIRQPKAQTLRQLMQSYASGVENPGEIWFVEDRLKTLQSVQAQPDLQTVRLFLADWGYNTTMERQTAQLDEQIRLISLPIFAQEFSTWNDSELLMS